MKLVCISDTHKQHLWLETGSGDTIIHAGDMSGTGRKDEVESFIDWYSKLDFTHKIYVPGNHEIGLEKNYDEWKTWFKDTGITLLNDESTTIEGFSMDNFEEYSFKVYGSPITPNFGRWAFMKARGEQINAHWCKIPKDTDILVTHGPPHGILDGVERFQGYVEHVGCEMLLERVQQVNPKLHIFGHIHEGAGSLIAANGCEYINAAMCNEYNQLTHKPIVRRL